jgi:membrane protease YdiL (CAAX protease family)
MKEDKDEAIHWIWIVLFALFILIGHYASAQPGPPDWSPGPPPWTPPSQPCWPPPCVPTLLEWTLILILLTAIYMAYTKLKKK